MRLYSYILKDDYGFAPNPFFGNCTLACCKPKIRKGAQIGDWVVGLTPKPLGNRVAYAMRVDEKLTFTEYWNDPRFSCKKPDYTRDGAVYRQGDNIYEPASPGCFRQLHSRHSDGELECSEHKTRDLEGTFVLIANRFFYFGSGAIALPTQFSCLVVGRAHKCNFPESLVQEFISFVSNRQPGVNAPPRNWPSNDLTWKQ